MSRQNSGASLSSLPGSAPAEYSSFSMPPVRMDDKERRSAAQTILKLLLDTPILQTYLLDLLCAK